MSPTFSDTGSVVVSVAYRLGVFGFLELAPLKTGEAATDSGNFALLDIVNPLQHIPLVNVAYRALTGDEIYGAARLFDVGFGPAAGAVEAAFSVLTLQHRLLPPTINHEMPDPTIPLDVVHADEARRPDGSARR